MASITVVYDSISESIPKIESLADECSNLAGQVGEVSGELDGIGTNHDSCFANSISAIDVLSTFVSKMGAEYDAIASFAQTSINTFTESEGQIIANAAKIDDMKTMLSYLGMSEASVRALDFNNINGYKTMADYNKADDDHKANIALYEEYYKDTNADLGEVAESAILDMMVTSDGKGSYRTVTTEEMKKYIEERAKAQVSSEAVSTVTGPYTSSVASSGAYTSGVVSSSSPSTSSTKLEDKKEEKDKEKEIEEEKEVEEKEDTTKEENVIKEEDTKEETTDTDKKDDTKDEVKDDKKDEQKEERQDNKKEEKTEPKQETVVKYVEASEPKTTKAATSNAQSVGNVTNNTEETPAPTENIEEPEVEPTPEEPLPEEDPLLEDETYDTTQDDSTRTTIPLPTEDTKKSSSSSSVVPAIAGIATAAAAGIGTKIYLDRKANNDEDDYEGEDEEEYSYDYDDSDSADVSSGAYIQSPDSTWDSGQEESNLKY